MESELARNYRKKAEYQKSQGIVVTAPPVQGKHYLDNDNLEQEKSEGEVDLKEDSESEYSYFSESEEEGEGPSENQNQRIVFSEQDLKMIQRT